MKGARQKAIDRVLEEWARETAKLLPKRTRDLIRGARWDLFQGPMSKEDARAEGIKKWPGFSKAVIEISQEVDAIVPRQLFVDTDAEQWFEEEPQFDTQEDWEFAMEAGAIYQIDHRDLVNALVGRDLAEYLR